MDLFAWVRRLLYWLIVHLFFVWTGEAVLWVVTLARHAPQWDLSFQSGTLALEMLSFWVGFVFWVVVGVVLFQLLT